MDVDGPPPKQPITRASDDNILNAIEFASPSNKRERRNSLSQSKQELENEGFDVLNEFSEEWL